MLGLYLHRGSPLHRLPAGAKLAALFLAAAALLLWPTPWLLGVAGLAGLGLTLAAQLPLTVLAAQLRPLLVVLVPVFVAQAALAGWQEGLGVVARCAVLVVLATLVTLTTRVSDMMDTLERALRPLRRLGVNAGKVSLMLTLVARLVPLLVDLVTEIRLAQRARGGERHPGALLVPLLVKTLRMADTLAEALEARGYDPR
jgi:biotin transport system permease protein